MQTERESTTPSSPHTFGTQSAAWLEELKTRRRDPVAPATIATYSAHLKRLVPLVGADTPLVNINSATLKTLVGQLLEKELSPKTITEMLMIVKQIKTSCVDADGNPIFSCQWNGKYIDAPSISKQKRPCPRREEVEKAIKDARDHQTQLLFAILAGSGLRISEALAIHFQESKQQTSWTAESSAVVVRSTIFRGKELLGHTKSDAGTRQVDLYPSLNDAITEFVKSNRKTGDLLFQSDGKPFQSRSALNQLRKLGYGFHGLRRFRISRLDNGGVPRRLTQLWAGHGAKDLTDVYVSAEDAEFRKGWAKQIGLGFSLEKVGDPPPQKPKSPKPIPPKKPKPDPRRASMVVTKTLVKRHKKRTLAQFIAQNTTKPTGSRFRASDEDLPAALFESVPVADGAHVSDVQRGSRYLCENIFGGEKT